MPLTISDPATLRLACRLAAATGEPLAQAVHTALAERLARVGKVPTLHRSEGDLTVRLIAIAEHCATQPVHHARGEDEILGYDERGLPGPD